MQRVSTAVFFLAIVGLLVGCPASGPTTYPVSGTVTLDGEPLEQGSILLDPTDGQGQAVSADISQGKFETTSTPGPKRIEISASVETSEKDEYGELITEEIIPAKYHVDSELTEDVTAEGPNEFTFTLSKESDEK